MTKVLFLCSRNSARSQMAEGFARTLNPKDVHIASAGTEAGELHPMATRVMAASDIDISGHKSKTLADLPSLDFDIVITLCSRAAETCPLFPGNPHRIDWNLPDPAAVKGDEKELHLFFEESRDTIRRLVDDFFNRGYLAALVAATQSTRLILDNIWDGIVAHDLERRIVYFNKAAQDITGYRHEDVINRDCHEVFPGNLCGGKCVFCDDDVPDMKPRQRRIQIATKTGEDRIADSYVQPMINTVGEKVGFLVAFHDITKEITLARRLGDIQHFSGIIGRDEKMLEIFDLIRELAGVTVPVLIQGESGTGKELVAAAVHNEGPRANRLFVPVNCGALPESLLESELFGHVKGAFTGAIRDKKGRFELADKGTIFLDEIADIPTSTQVKLLRVLQEGRFERVGSETTIKVDVRVISASNKNLSTETAEGRFREDLFYRLNVVPVNLPPLRDRRLDIPLLVQHTLDRLIKESGRPTVEISEEALDIMLSYHWPGNVRELQNWLQFALVKCRTAVIMPEHLPPVTPAAIKAAARRRKRKLDPDSVRAALTKAGNKVEAAKLLGVSRATLYRFLDSSGITG
jgi:PAS domain S-box-containing protein